MPDVNILVIDDSSPDVTQREVKRLREKNKNILLLTRPYTL